MPNDKLFSVVEYSSFFAVRHNPTGKEAPMGDGVDTLFTDEGAALNPGVPGFVPAWEDALNSDEDETRAAYFPELPVPGSYRAADHKEWDAQGLDTIFQRHEMEYVNQEDDGCDCTRGEWYAADDDTLTIFSGSFGNDNSPGASHYTYAEVYETREEYTSALAEWEAKPEYLPASAHCPKCGGACADYDDEAHDQFPRYRTRGACDDYACESCELVFDSDSVSFLAD